MRCAVRLLRPGRPSGIIFNTYKVGGPLKTGQSDDSDIVGEQRIAEIRQAIKGGESFGV